MVSIDAAGCKRNIAAKIVDAKGDYVLALKGNPGKLHDAVIQYIVGHMENDFNDVTACNFTERFRGTRTQGRTWLLPMTVPEDFIAQTLRDQPAKTS
ncbi:hypothetical protein FHS27_006355 [Rhodopirellula rubra]|uniref:Transposase n=2 Tax=Aporhodopirellula rubra TaxID=980271 RepID=A0A7W5E6J7_9BACT|nr:hypothetical protein [Aporhodopirellula rubra]